MGRFRIFWQMFTKNKMLRGVRVSAGVIHVSCSAFPVGQGWLGVLHVVVVDDVLCFCRECSDGCA